MKYEAYNFYVDAHPDPLPFVVSPDWEVVPGLQTLVVCDQHIPQQCRQCILLPSLQYVKIQFHSEVTLHLVKNT